MTEIPYDTDTSPAWVTTVSGWPWIATATDHGKPTSWEKRGPCPRCDHAMNVSVGLDESILPVDTVDASCNCSHPHQASRTGCGQDARIDPPASR